MSLIRFKVIKIKRAVAFILIIIALLGILIICKNKVKDNAMPVFNAMGQNSFSQNPLRSIREDRLKKLLCWGLPALKTFNMEKAPVINLSTVTKNLSQLLTNIDIYDPKTYFALHLPLINLMKTEAVITPGIEYLPEKTPIIENEHEPQDNQHELSPEEIEESTVEKIEPISGKPLVLIYHTHTTESYTPSPGFDYKPRDKTYHTENLNFTVAKVGEVMTQELQQLNIPTLHNKTVHDIPTYMTSYSNSLKTVEEVLKQNPSIKIIIDLHRDAPMIDPQKSREITTVKIDGINYSRLMFVMGSDKTFPHPHWRENYQFALLLNDRLEQSYPGISRGINPRKERFNQHLSKKAILLEIGSHGNTMEESIESAKVFAKILSNLIKELSIE